MEKFPPQVRDLIYYLDQKIALYELNLRLQRGNMLKEI